MSQKNTRREKFRISKKMPAGKTRVKSKHRNKQKGDKVEIYGILNERNIDKVQFGLNKLFSTWYGSTVYFNKDLKKLGIYESVGDDDENDNHETKADTINSEATTESSHSEPNDIDESNSNPIWLDTLYVCEYCFKYTSIRQNLIDHERHCSFKLKSPGKIKYKSPEFTIKRVKGYQQKLFCQCLCLFTKLFLDNKSIYFKVENYDFYILYRTNSTVPMAFFSKDLLSYNQNNLACILVFPPYQRMKLGSLLIEFSYKLSRADDLLSGPEFPLSPFGLIGYLHYWSHMICWTLLEGPLANFPKVSVRYIAKATGFRINDVITTLQHIGCVKEEDAMIDIQAVRKFYRQQNAQFMCQDEYLLIKD